MFENEIAQNRFLLGYGRMMFSDIDDERMAEQPLPAVNHPAWILGHLIYSAEGAIGRLDGQKTLSPEWIVKFGPGSTVQSTRAAYPSKEELVRELESRFAAVRQLAAQATAEQVARPNPIPRMKETLPTVGHLVGFLMTGHLAVHLGQLSVWRRMIGMPPMF